MRAYIITSGVIFALITLAHILRAFIEGPHLARDPVFIFLTLLAAGLALWAWRVLKRASTPPGPASGA